MTILPNGIEVEGLTREFKGGVRAVDGIDLTVEPGEIYGFLGPNGAGKSTTMRLLTGQAIPDSGELRVLGYELPFDAKAARAEARQRADGGRDREQRQQARQEDRGVRQAARAAADHGQKAAAQPRERGGGDRKGDGAGGGNGKGGGKKD